MALEALQLKTQAETAVQTREQALDFANAALARRRHCGDPLKDYGTAERERARAICSVCEEYYRMRTAGGFTRDQAAAALLARPDLAGTLVEEGRRLPAGTLDHWLAALGGSVKDAKPPRESLAYAVCRAYGKGAAKRIEANVLPEDFMAEFWQAFLNQNRMLVAPAYRTAREICLRRDPLAPIPEQHQVRHWLKTRVNERVLAKARLTDERYQAGLGGYVMRDWNRQVGEVWVGDHRILDLWVQEPGPDGRPVAMRPWVTAWMDVKSGYMVSTLIYADAYPSHTAILQALYFGIRGNGGRPPKILLTDNGKDYLKQGALQDARLQPDTQPTRGRSRHRTLVEETFEEALGEHRHSVARELGIACETSAPYKGRQKPIERRFRDFAQEFDRLWPGYTGNCPAARPDYGQDYRGNPATLPTCEQLRAAFRDWLAGYHARPNNSRITGGRPPETLWGERPELRPAMDEEQIQWAMLVPHRHALQVRRGPSGCDVWYHGWPYSGDTPDDCLALREHWRQDIMVKVSWAPEHTFQYGGRELPLRAWAFDLAGKFICDLRAVETVTVWGRSEAKAERIARAMERIKVVAKADREQRNLLRGRTRMAFPARQLYPHGAGELPEAEGGPVVARPMLPGPGKGRARIAAAAGEPPPATPAGDWDDTGGEEGSDREAFLAFMRQKNKER